MRKLFACIASGLLLTCFSCKTSKMAFNPDKKYAPQELKADYSTFRNILEESHPALYWYTPKDSMDFFFDRGYCSITDSMTESQFRTLLSYVIAKIDCGHTSVRYSKNYSNYLDTVKLKSFPLILKFWGDSMVVSANLNRKDSVLKRGTSLKSINGRTQRNLTDTLFNYLVTDGYNSTGKYQSLSSGLSFGSWYKNIFGLTDTLSVVYYDTNGMEENVRIPLYDPLSDTLHYRRDSLMRQDREGHRGQKRQFINAARSLQIDTSANTAFMTINTFSNGNKLKSFFKSSFRELDEKKISNLVIDVRSNGGGDATNSTMLTKYLIDKKFKLADSLYAITRHSAYGKYIEKNFLYELLMTFVTKKQDDGKYHFGYFERHYFHPKTKHHFNGKIYILIGGNSFSATALFASFMKGQPNVILVGEETGGGYYGNTAWIIPEVTLPKTNLRFRLPKFRLVIDKNREKNGRGVMPDVYALPSSNAIRKGIDFKAEKARKLIFADRSSNQPNPHQ